MTSFFKKLLTSSWSKVFLAVVVIYFLVASSRIDFKDFKIALQNWEWLLGAFILMLPTYFIVSYRFWIVLKNQNINVSFYLAMKWTMIGSFFDIAMPSNSGGDIIKGGYIVHYLGKGSRTKGIMAVFFDRILGLLGLFLVAGIAGIIGWNTINIIKGGEELLAFIIIIFTLIIFFFKLIGSKRLNKNEKFIATIVKIPFGEKIFKVIQSFNILMKRPIDLLVILFLSVLNHAFWCTSLLCIVMAFNQDIVILQGLTIFPIAIFSNIFGYAGGFGVGTMAFDMIFSNFLNIQIGASIGLTFQILSAFSRVIGLPFYLFSSKQDIK